MIKKSTLFTIIIVNTFFVSCLYSTAEDIPSPPHRFKGYVIDETGELAIDNTSISAKLNNIFYNTTVKNGTYGFPTETEAFYVNGSEGDGVIHFYIDGVLTSQTAVFVSGGLNNNFFPYLNLSLDSTPLIISSVTASSYTSSQATITWTTDKSANSTVNYGATQLLGHTKQDGSFIKNHSLTLISLQSATTYYYEVVSYDYSSHIARDNNSGTYYQFTTEQIQEGNEGNGGGVLPPVGDTNHPPKAQVNGPYYGLINTPVTFDASQSNDTDGYIVNYSWNLGDGTVVSTNQVRITHTYLQIGNYTVMLTVTDNKGAKNSTMTKAYISTNDSDADGWSNEAEEIYGTNPTNASDFPKDNDDDGIPDGVDPDDDNDGLSDEIETHIGTNPTNSSDALRLLTMYGLFYLVDTNADGTIDTYYNQTTGALTELFDTGNGTFLIDINNDSTYDFEYHSVQQSITAHQTQHTADQPSTMLLILVSLIIVCVIIGIIGMLLIKREKK